MVADTISVQGYSWSFGDGGTASVASPIHSYTAAGRYQISFAVTTTSGSQLRAETYAEVVEMPTTSGWSSSFEMHFEVFANAITATARLGQDPGGPPGSPKRGFAAISIYAPDGRILRTGWRETVVDAVPQYLPELASPAPGVWRGVAEFVYYDAADPVPIPHYLGYRSSSVLVPLSQPCQECVTIGPGVSDVLDGDSQVFTLTAPNQLPVDATSWAYEKPAGASTTGQVVFSSGGNGLNPTSAKATWFAFPDQQCGADLRQQAIQGARYTIRVAIQQGSQIALGSAALHVKVPWGLHRSLQGSGIAAQTFAPIPLGIYSRSCPQNPSPTNPCRILGPGTMHRGAPFICYRETGGSQECTALQQEILPFGGLMPSTSSFRNKLEVHEGKHVDQYGPGGLKATLWQVEGGPDSLMDYSADGVHSIRNLTAPSSAELTTQLRQLERQWRDRMVFLDNQLSSQSEQEAYAAAAGTPPLYIYYWCNLGTE